MRRRRLPDSIIAAAFRRLSGDDAAQVVSAYRIRAQDYAVKFSIGDRSLTIAVPVGWMHRSIETFNDEFTVRVTELFRQHEAEQGARVDTHVPVRSPGYVPVQSLGEEGVNHA